MLPISSISHASHAPEAKAYPSALKSLTAVAFGALATARGANAAASLTSFSSAPSPAPALPNHCPALPLPCACVAAPPSVPSAPIAQNGVPEVFVTTPSAYLDEGVRVIVAQRPDSSNETSLFAFTCIDSLGDNTLSSVSCGPSILGIDQAGLLAPVSALNFALDPANGVSNGPNQVLLDYTVILKSIYDAPCTHTSLAQGLAYNLDANDICGVLTHHAAIFNDTKVVTHFQEALRDALHEEVPRVCYED
jgi:hypothetical protein